MASTEIAMTEAVIIKLKDKKAISDSCRQVQTPIKQKNCFRHKATKIPKKIETTFSNGMSDWTKV
jgi:hypothetical protein